MKMKKKNGLLMDVICVLLLLCSLLRLSFVSVVFDFNASLSDVAPLSPILLSVCFDENRKEWFVISFVHNSGRVL